MAVKLLGLNIDIYSFEQAFEIAKSLIMLDNKASQIVTINPEIFSLTEKSSNFKQIVNNSELIIPDGVGIKIALNIFGYKAERIPGIDFAKKLLYFCNSNRFPVAIIGATESILNKSIENLKNEMPNLNIIYAHNGYFDDHNVIINELIIKKPRLILVAMGAPKQEEFSYIAKNKLSCGLSIGIGGSLDVWSGNVKRAPKIFQKTGTEWLYRTIIQPKRFRRIFPTLPLFLIKVFKARIFNRSI